MTDEDEQALSRPQRRLLRRIYNGRTVPVVAGGRSFLTFREASRYLRSLDPEACEAAYEEMKRSAASPPEADPARGDLSDDRTE